MTTLAHPALAGRPDAPTPAPAPQGRPELAKALSAAQKACRPAEKDSYNEFHKYHYASAEAIITEAKAALAAGGLALVPLEQTLLGSARDGGDRFELERKFLLLHPSGECLPLVSHWPVVPDKGRPLDKATASAATASLAYLLRDLLLMPRVAPEDDLPARQDRPRAEKGAAAPPAAPPAAPGRSPADVKLRESRARQIGPLMDELGVTWAEVCKDVNRPGVGITGLTDAEFCAALATLQRQVEEMRSPRAAPASKPAGAA